jgi:HTH-type transcriptional regulator/antitoxin MqsA
MTEKTSLCPVCDSGELYTHTYSDTFKHNGQPLQVHGLEGCECPVCGADPILPDQIKQNQMRIADAKRHADGMLSGLELRQVREQLGLTQRQAAEIFGGGAKAFAKYERGEVVQSAAMDSLLRLVDRYSALLGEVAAFRGVGYRTPKPGNGTYLNVGSIHLGGERRYRRGTNLKVVTAEQWERDVA